MKTLSRRALLRGAGGIAIGLPLLNVMGPSRARAQAVAFPKRLATFYTPNGFDRGSRPTSMTLTGTSLEPLAPHASDILILRGIDMTSGLVDPNPNDGSHYNGWAHCLVADSCYPGSGSGAGRTGGNISYDMAAAARIGRSTRFQSTLLGIHEAEAVSWFGPNMPATADTSPSRVFGRLFTDLNADPLGLAEARARRRSILDYASAQTQRLGCRLGAEDRQRLDAHLAAIRDVESRLEAGAVSATACAAPAQPGSGLDFPATGHAQMDMLAMAFACDLSRVGSVQYSRAASGGTPTWVGLNETHHDISHQHTDDGRAKVKRIDTWYAQQFAYLLDRLKAVPEGNGTLLDHSVILWMSEGSDNGHGRHDIDVVIAGRAGGALRTGEFINFTGTPHNNLLLELINSVLPAGETPLTTFGNPNVCTGGLPQIRA